MNVLFADNDPDFLNTRAAYLRLAGYEVLKASTPSEAEALLRTVKITLAILDTRLQDDDDERDISGLVLAENPELRHIPKIILTNYASLEGARRALVRDPDGIAPAVDYILKESGPETMLQAVQQAIDTYVRKLSQPIPPDDLVQACLQGNCVAFIEAGLSLAAGYPSWQVVVKGLLERAMAEGFIEPPLAISYLNALESERLDLATDGVISAIRAKDQTGKLLQTQLAEFFDSRAVELTPMHRLLSKIGFSAAITTNIDTLVERAFDCTTPLVARDADSIATAVVKREFFVLKLSGEIQRPETLQIGLAQRREAASSDRTFAQVLEKLFLSRMILFLGASLDDLMADLAILPTYATGYPNYALVAVSRSEWQTNAWQANATSLQRRYNVIVLPYTADDGDAQVLAFLQTLTERIAARRKSHKPARSPTQPPILRRVCLENIGPFDNLELSLDPHWNVLLGDNGVGKSNILKAIALAMCGKDAEPYAERLIRCGQPNGCITLELTDGSRNTTELYRTSTGPELKVLSQRELVGAEQWLAIGFPPLRQVDWTLLNGPQSRQTVPYTSSGDLLPLVKGAIDPRMDDFKQTIINLDYRANKDRRSRKLLRELFDLIGCAAEGMTLRLGSIDPQTWAITVVTDDGKVPIESVSQGTQSIMGWLAILLQRLYEVYDQSAAPKNKPALVLVDEIDAHMHPAWQQSIVRSLSNFFPKVQFIATTHSPLVVTELRPSQVYVLRRDFDTSKISAHRSDEDFTGFRADQVLTSSLFGLRRSRGSAAATGLSRYSELLGKKRTPDEEHELIELQARVQAWMTAQDTPLARRIEEAIRNTMAQAELPDEVKLEVRRQLAELTGNGEPQI